MRRPALIALILLLAWRAWLGDAMALGLSSEAAVPIRAATALSLNLLDAEPKPMSAHATHGVTPPCHELADTPEPGLTDTSHSAHPTHGGACSACQICHLALLSPQLNAQQLPALRFATPPSAEGRFQSACLNPRLKPPIA
jgi:hypothetical protein